MSARGRIALALLPALAGCALVGKADAPVTLRLSSAVAAPATALDPRAVAVLPVHAGGDAAQTRYAYVDPARPGEIHQAASLFWDQPPPRLVERALVAGLRGRFVAVSGPEASLPADLREVTVLDRFEEVSGSPGRAVVAFDVTVIAAGKLARSASYCASVPFAGAGASERASAFDAALGAAAAAFARDLTTGAMPAPAPDC